MKDSGTTRLIPVLVALGLLAASADRCQALAMTDDVIPLLKTKTTTYTNVTVTAKTETDLCFLHEGGAGNVCLEDLELEAHSLVGYVPAEPTGEKLKILANEQAAKMVQAWQGASANSAGPGLGQGSVPIQEINPVVLLVMAVVGFAFYLFFCYCYMLICKKAGDDPGLLIWIPILQIFPLFRAAGMSGWYVLGMFLPIINIIIPIVWCFKIVSARGKSPLWAVLMLLPFTNLIALLYLAFSEGVDEDLSGSSPPRLPGLAVRTA